jgi:ABC-type multidrug transport system fused ATPase/permease subunit
VQTVKKINKILNSNQKRNFYILLIVTAFVSFLDLIGIGAILPVLIVLSDTQFIKNEYIIYILENFNFLNEGNFLFFTIYFLLFIFLFKIGLSLIFNLIKYKILFSFYQKITTRLMKTYLNLTYSEFIKLKVFEKTNIIKTEVEYFVLGVIDPFLILFLELLTVIFIFVFLIYYDAQLSIKLIFIIVLPVICMVYFFGKKMKKLGEQKHDLNNQLQLQTTQGLHGIKDIKLSSKENVLIEKFDKLTLNMSKTTSAIYYWQALPRHILEMITILAFIITVFIGLNNEKEFSELLVTLGIFAVAAFRIMPSLNRVVVSFNSIKQTIKVINVIYEDLKLDKKINQNNLDLNESEALLLRDIDLIEIKNLNFKFENTSNFLIKNLNLKINKGSYVGIYGKSGSGKTTFVDLFSGLLIPESGTIKFDNQDITEHSKLWKRSISYVPQFIYVNNASIRENIAFGNAIDDKKVIESLKYSQLLEDVNALPNGIATIVGENGKNLSGGQIQRMGIARALYRDSKILIFDESTNSLDLDTEDQFMEIVKNIKRDKVILFISHKISILKNCDIVYELTGKNLVEKNIK